MLWFSIDIISWHWQSSYDIVIHIVIHIVITAKQSTGVDKGGGADVGEETKDKLITDTLSLSALTARFEKD